MWPHSDSPEGKVTICSLSPFYHHLCPAASHRRTPFYHHLCPAAIDHKTPFYHHLCPAASHRRTPFYHHLCPVASHRRTPFANVTERSRRTACVWTKTWNALRAFALESSRKNNRQIFGFQRPVRYDSYIRAKHILPHDRSATCTWYRVTHTIANIKKLLT